jgi:2-deoxy-D-gluconate 3-dehydrogenase
MANPFDLTGRKALVTGGATGIGEGIALALAGAGADVALTYRSHQPDETIAKIEAMGGKAAAVKADFDGMDQAAAADVIGFARDAMGGLDILVSNVSAMNTSFRDCVEIDIIGVQALLRAGLARMEDHLDANIVCISSRAASVGIPYLQSYAAVKAATVSMAKSMAVEVARRGIRVNVVSPGDIIFPGGTWEDTEKNNPKLFNAVLKENPFRRLGKPEEIGDVVAFVASDRSSFVSGANILVDGAATKSLQL